MVYGGEYFPSFVRSPIRKNGMLTSRIESNDQGLLRAISGRNRANVC